LTSNFALWFEVWSHCNLREISKQREILN